MTKPAFGGGWDGGGGRFGEETGEEEGEGEGEDGGGQRGGEGGGESTDDFSLNLKALTHYKTCTFNLKALTRDCKTVRAYLTFSDPHTLYGSRGDSGCTP